MLPILQMRASRLRLMLDVNFGISISERKAQQIVTQMSKPIRTSKKKSAALVKDETTKETPCCQA